AGGAARYLPGGSGAAAVAQPLDGGRGVERFRPRLAECRLPAQPGAPCEPLASLALPPAAPTDDLCGRAGMATGAALPARAGGGSVDPALMVRARVAAPPVVQLDHLVVMLGRGLEGVRLQLDGAEVAAEHADAAGQALLAGDGELEAVDARQAPPAVAVADPGQAAEGDVAVQQLDVQLGAVLLGQRQGPFANAVAA